MKGNRTTRAMRKKHKRLAKYQRESVWSGYGNKVGEFRPMGSMLGGALLHLLGRGKL